MKSVDWVFFIFVVACVGLVIAVICATITANEHFEYEYDDCVVKVEIVKAWGEPDRTIVDEFCRE